MVTEAVIHMVCHFYSSFEFHMVQGRPVVTDFIRALFPPRSVSVRKSCI